jgi:hypothetical protein
MVLRVLVVAAVCAVTAIGCASSRDQPSANAAREGEQHVPAQPLEEGGLQSGELFDVLAQMDRELFEASFETCDAAKANAIFADDVEFYHDQTGLMVGEQVRENTRRLTASCPARRGVKRTLVPGSLRVFPIQGYGAAQIGMHRFDERGAKTSTLAKFVNLWRFQDGRWRLARVLSLDHRAVPPLASTPAGQPATLQ